MKATAFRSRYVRNYDHFIKKDANAYRQMLEWIRPAVKGKNVLELATGTGLIAKNILHDAAMVEATDCSPEMIEQAKASCVSSKLHFSVQDICALPYADESFPVIIASNVLHVIPEPNRALDEIRRVLTDDGLLIVPTFTYGDSGPIVRLKAQHMALLGFPLYQRWSSGTYLDFLTEHGWTIQKTASIKATFPLTYAECRKGATGHLLPCS